MSNLPLDSLLESDLTRRDLLRHAVAGALLTMPWLDAVAAPSPIPPAVPFTKNRAGDGLIGPFGEVRIASLEGVVLPAFVTAAGGLAAMNLAVRAPSIQIGADDTMIILTSAGVQFGKAGGVKAWTRDSLQAIVNAIVRDPRKARGIMLLRSALHTTLPVAAMQMKGRLNAKFAGALAASTSGLGARSMLTCVTTTITETVTRTFTEMVEVWKSAEKQYQECYDREVGRSPCKDALLGAGLCAAGICSVKGFVDVVVGMYEVVRTVTEEVTRTLVICTRAPIATWPNPWDLTGVLGKITVDQPKRQFTDKDIAAAIDLLAQFTGFFGIYAKCLLRGKWSLLQLTTPLDFGDGNIVLPYGIKVCVSAQCARDMAFSNVGSELASSWQAALSVLAALSPEFAALAATFGVSASGVVAGAILGAPELVVACAAVILAFILAALIYGTIVAAQLEYHRVSTNNFDDGVVCIEHPTFAVAYIELMTQGFIPARAIPPIVTG